MVISASGRLRTALNKKNQWPRQLRAHPLEDDASRSSLGAPQLRQVAGQHIHGCFPVRQL